MKLLGFLIFALVVANSFLSGMIYADSEQAPSIEQCEQVAGVGNCLRINGYMPVPRPAIVVPADPLPSGQES